MLYSRVYIHSFGYELPQNVITSDDLEEELKPVYEKLRLKKGQLEALTGVRERRFWDPVHKVSDGAIKAGKKVIESSSIDPKHIKMLVYGGVCRDNLEPATACSVANGLGLGADVEIYDVSNACLGVINGIIQVANAIELGHIRAGMVVSCESARQIVYSTIDRIRNAPDMETFKKTVATLTGGSGAVAVILTDASLSDSGHRIIGGIVKNASQYHTLCTWGPDTGIPASGLNVMNTDPVGVLKNGLTLGVETFAAFKKELTLTHNQPDKIICHQVGSAHQKSIRDSICISDEKDFTTFQFLGNMGTVSLPLTAAIADEREFLRKNDIVAFLGIGSGLNCIMLGIDW